MISTKDVYLFKRGDRLQITNNLRDEFGIISIVMLNSINKSRLIDIKEVVTNNKYTRA